MKKLLLAVASVFGFSSGAASSETDMEHAVIVRFQYGSTNLNALFKAEDRLEAQ